MTSPDVVTLLINGMRYSGWTEISMSRGIDRCVSKFDFAGVDRINGPFVSPFNTCQVFVDDDLWLTGYVERVEPDFAGKKHDIRVVGQSKTKDLVDCDLDIPSGQFSGFTVAAIGRAVCQIFNIGLVILTGNADQVVQNTNVGRSETAFRFLERLCNLAGVLLTDDVNGNLVMTDAGQTRSASRLVQGVNMLAGKASYNVEKRFSHYIVLGQSGIGGGDAMNLDGAGGISANPSVGTVQTAMRAVAIDTGVPRYRPRVTLAESQLTPEQMQARANWQMQFAYGQSIKIPARVQGFRQADGALWTSNIMVPVIAPWLYADLDLLVVETTLTLDAKSKGHVVDLTLGPIEGYTPDPAKVKLRKAKKGKGVKGGGGGLNLSGAGGIS